MNVVGLGFHPSQSTSSLCCNRIDEKICYKSKKIIMMIMIILTTVIVIMMILIMIITMLIIEML